VSENSTPRITWHGNDFAVTTEIVKLGQIETSVQVPAVDDPWLRRFIASLVAFERIEGANEIAPAQVLEMAACRYVEKGGTVESWLRYEIELGVPESRTRKPRSIIQRFLRWSRGGRPDHDGRLTRLSGAFDAWLAEKDRPDPYPRNGGPGTSELAQWLRRNHGYQAVADAYHNRLEFEAALNRGAVWVTHANGTERVYDGKEAAESQQEGPAYEEPAEWWDLEGCKPISGEYRRREPRTNEEDGNGPLPERIKGDVRPAFPTRPANNYSESNTERTTARRHPWEYATHNRRYALCLPPESAEWYSPPPLFQALDPASPGADVVPWIPAKRHFTRSDNGLEQDWGDDFVWLNAPYTKEIFPLWLEKFRQHANGVCLTVDRTSARWWQELCSNADLILQVNKKVRFLRPPDEPTYSSPALGHTLVAYGPRGVEALINAARNGLGALLVPYGKLAAKENDIAELKARIAALEGENSTLKARGTDRDNATPPERS
jgi:hypothetical protein